MKTNIKVLLVEDSEADTMSFKRNVKKLNLSSESMFVEYETSTTLKETMIALEKTKFDLVLLDLSLPDASNLDGLTTITSFYGTSLPIIVLSGQSNERMAMDAIKNGAQDYLQKKDISPFNLGRSIGYSLERSRSAREIEDLRVSQAKSLKMATLGEMAGGLAHEINNPLSIILGYADLLQRGESKNFKTEDYVKFGEKISDMTNRIAKIVKSLKSYSRNDVNDPMITTKLTNIVDDTLSLCSEKFKTAQVDLIVDEIVNVELLCKDVQLSQVLLNLLSNAFDAVKDSQEKWIRLYSQSDGINLNLYVSDSGEIVEKKIKRKIFQPFFTTKDKGHGTGLGMSISKSIIESHNGTIELLEASERTTFKVSLPLKRKNLEAA